MRLFVAAVLIGGIIAVGSVHAEVFDDFEDGNYTADPPWTVAYAQGAAEVVSDPVRPENLVLGGYGTETGHHVLQTPATMPWTSFDVSLEVLTLNNDFSPAVFLMRGDEHVGNPNYSLNLDVRREPGDTATLLRIDEFDQDHPSFVRQMVYFDADPLETWWHVRMRYEGSTQQVRVEIRDAADEALLFEHAFAPAIDLDVEPAFDYLKLGFEETSWSYMDNVELIPEPTGVLLLVAGLIARRWR